MNGRLRPTSTMSPRRSTVIVTDGPSGASASVVTGSAGGVWPCARAVAATASIAVPLSSARRPTILGDVFCMGVLGCVSIITNHGAQPLRHARTLRSARQPVLPRRDDLRRGLGLGLERRGVRSDPRPLPRARRQLHRHRERLHEGPLREDHRRPHRPRPRAGATASSSPRSSSATCIPAIRTAAARAARRSSPRASSRCAGCRPTTSISTGCTAGTRTRRSTRRCARSTTSCAAGKVRYIGFSDTPAWKVGAGADDRALPRLVAARRAADRVLAARAHGRRRADPDGAGARPRRHAVVAARRAACSPASTRARTRRR